MHYYVFNGDADGIIAYVQLTLAEGERAKDSALITGVKRDIALLKQVDLDSATRVTVLDISMEKNIEALTQLLAQDVPVFYADHHRTGELSESIAQHSQLDMHVDLDANTCTSLIVNGLLANKFVLWAIAASYGDNMLQSAEQLADKFNVSIEDRNFLKALGIYVNYNGYGQSVDDLHIAPQTLAQELVKFENPLQLREDKSSVFYQLENAYQQDMNNASEAKVHHDNAICKVIELPNQTWARRVSGVLGNDLANQSPDKAHAVLTKNPDDSFTVSVRAPLNNKQGADKVCIQFETGGGRAAAAGINKLAFNELDRFIGALNSYYQ